MFEANNAVLFLKDPKRERFLHCSKIIFTILRPIYQINRTRTVHKTGHKCKECVETVYELMLKSRRTH